MEAMIVRERAINTKKRCEEIDIMRGIAILLVVLGHSIGVTTDPMNRFILSFHMPLFFIISGMVSEGSLKRPFRQLLLDKVKGHLRPQVFLGIVLSLYAIIMYAVLHEVELNEINFLNFFIGYWFLIVLFFTSVLYWLLRKVLNTYGIQTQSVLLGVLVVVCIFVEYIHDAILFVHVVPVALFFYVIGNLVSTKCICFFEMRYKRVYVIGALCVPLVVVISQLNEPVLMYSNQYGSLFAFGICALGGTWIVLTLASLSRNNTFLKFCGKNAISFYVFHWSVLQSVRGFFNILRGSLLSISDDMLGYVVFIISLPIVFVIAWFIERYCPLLLGGKVNKKRRGVEK